MTFENVFVIADTLEAISELAGGAQALAKQSSCCVFGEKEEEAQEALKMGYDWVYAYKVSKDRMIEDYAKAIVQLILENKGDIVLLSTTGTGRLLAGKIGALLKSGVTANIASVTPDGVTKKMVYGGSAHREEKRTSGIPVITVGAGTFEEGEIRASGKGEVVHIDVVPETRIRRIGQRKKGESTVNLAKSKRIIDVGRGLVDEKDLEMCNDLAKVMEADVGCSRPVAESNGWMPVSRYIGVTGCVVSPDILLALGVSGQVQHIVGIVQSKTVIAINKDPNALIFQHADFGLVGDIYKVVPKLIERLK